jgi:dihydropteroate synthase
MKSTSTMSKAARLAHSIRQAHGQRRPLVMGIVNITPDSFSDGGRYYGHDIAVAHALKLAGQGADILDIGGESTRPGAESVSLAQELDRVIPVIESLVSRTDVPISIDTSKPEVMREAVRAGALMINDVNGLRAEGALATAAEAAVPICVMHMQGQPRTMQKNPRYEDVVVEVRNFLAERMEACVAAGIPRDYLSVDPGFGFGKSLEHNLALLRRQEELLALDVPLLIGISRKSMLGAVTGREDPDQRLAASIAAAVLAAERGAAILRVHDVVETVDAIKLTRAVLTGGTTSQG